MFHSHPTISKHANFNNTVVVSLELSRQSGINSSKETIYLVLKATFDNPHY